MSYFNICKYFTHQFYVTMQAAQYCGDLNTSDLTSTIGKLFLCFISLPFHKTFSIISVDRKNKI